MRRRAQKKMKMPPKSRDNRLIGLSIPMVLSRQIDGSSDPFQDFNPQKPYYGRVAGKKDKGDADGNSVVSNTIGFFWSELTGDFRHMGVGRTCQHYFLDWRHHRYRFGLKTTGEQKGKA
jgi:hypothetical protein